MHILKFMLKLTSNQLYPLLYHDDTILPSIKVVSVNVISDDIFLPREVECARMDDFEREIEEFKRSVVCCQLLQHLPPFCT